VLSIVAHPPHETIPFAPPPTQKTTANLLRASKSSP
jgi:hypothetical protein